MKGISRKLTIGAGRPSGSWLMLLFLLAVLVPSVCLLWFMNQAVHNERLAVRQRLVEAYRANLSLMQNIWMPTGAKPPPLGRRGRPSLRLPRSSHAMSVPAVADAVICFDAAGNVAYPAPLRPAKPEAPERAVA